MNPSEARRQRRRRDQRRRGIRVVLSERDRAVLRALARFRIGRTGDLAALAFQGVRADTAGKRLRRLFDAGFLDVQVGDRSEENVYALGPRGKEWIASQGGVVGPRPAGGIDHHLATVAAWTGIAMAAHELGIALELVRPDWEIRETIEAKVSPVIPDAMVQVRLSGRAAPARFALEVDLGTEGVAVLVSKVETYGRLVGTPAGLFGWRDFGLAVVLGGRGSQRRRAVEELLDRNWSGWWLAWDEKDGPRESFARLAQASAPTLTDSPYESP